MRAWMFVVLAACGGSKQAPKDPMPVPPASPCDVTARHMTDAVFGWKQPPPTSKDNVFAVLRKHCTDDKWSAEAMTCFGSITDEASSAPCAEKLTPDQLEKVMGEMMSKFENKKDGAAPTAQPPEAPAKGDPCEGGE